MTTPTTTKSCAQKNSAQEIQKQQTKPKGSTKVHVVPNDTFESRLADWALSNSAEPFYSFPEQPMQVFEDTIECFRLTGKSAKFDLVDGLFDGQWMHFSNVHQLVYVCRNTGEYIVFRWQNSLGTENNFYTEGCKPMVARQLHRQKRGAPHDSVTGEENALAFDLKGNFVWMVDNRFVTKNRKGRITNIYWPTHWEG